MTTATSTLRGLSPRKDAPGSIAHTLRILRLRANLTRESLAARVGKTAFEIQAIEQGKVPVSHRYLARAFTECGEDLQSYDDHTHLGWYAAPKALSAVADVGSPEELRMARERAGLSYGELAALLSVGAAFVRLAEREGASDEYRARVFEFCSTPEQWAA